MKETNALNNRHSIREQRHESKPLILARILATPDIVYRQHMKHGVMIITCDISVFSMINTWVAYVG